MAYLTRAQVSQVVADSLSTIADLPADIDPVTFTGVNDDKQHFFLSALKRKLNALPYYMNNGTTNHLKD